MAFAHKLSLKTAILINLNIMMGGGIFINTVELSKRTGLLSACMYPLVGILILPLIIAIAQLLKLHPSGGFYTFAQKEISPFIGFMSTWSYFIAKLASASLMIHISMSLITQIFPGLLTVAPLIVYDLCILTLFVCLNLANMKTGSRIQMGFLGFKLVPLFFVIGAGVITFAPSTLSTLPVIWHGVPSALPLVLFAAMGFEAICSLSNKIEDAERNGPKAIMYSFCIMMLLVFLFQFFFYTSLGNQLAMQANFLGAFPAFITSLFGSTSIAYPLTSLFHLAIATSALGGCYGVLYSNCWNLYILAEHKKIFGWSLLTQLTGQSIPIACIFIEWIFCCLYLLTTGGNQIILQQVAALGTVISYTICVAALYAASKRTNNQSHIYLTWAAFMSCFILIGACIRNFIIGGIIPLIGFIALFCVGIFLYRKNHN